MPSISISSLMTDLSKRLPRNIGEAALGKAQATCPIQTGDLYSSLYINVSGQTVELGASVPYAPDIEFGRDAVVVGGQWKGKWKRHKRQNKNGGTTTVRGHVKTFNKKKPVLISPSTNEWRTLGNSPAREGTFFMQKALEAAIAEAIEKELRYIGAKKR